MDFLTNRELNILAGEIEAKKYALEADKFMFERKLNNGLGEQMMQELSNPAPKKIKKGLFYRISHYFRSKKENRLYTRYDRHERACSLNEIPKELNKKKGDV